MEKYLPLLERTELFSKINKAQIQSILECLSAKTYQFPKGSYIFRAGQQIPTLALLLEGCVHIQREDYWGNRNLFHIVSPGEIFGEAYAALEGEGTANSARAAVGCTALFLDIHRVLTVCTCACRFHTLLIQNLFTAVSSKNRILTEKLGHLSQRTTREKLLSYLSDQSFKAGSSSFEIPLNRQQLADFLSVDRSAMSKELGKMRAEGILDFRRNHFFLNPDA